MPRPCNELCQLKSCTTDANKSYISLRCTFYNGHFLFGCLHSSVHTLLQQAQLTHVHATLRVTYIKHCLLILRLIHIAVTELKQNRTTRSEHIEN